MQHIAVATLSGLAIVAGSTAGVSVSAAKADQMDQTPRSPQMAPARDPAIAVDEEYRIALAHGTAEALALFIARHGDDPLADKARAELRRLNNGVRR